jgi:Spy/CpxP family protein refolding chaperone
MQRIIAATMAGLLAVALASTTHAQAPAASRPSPADRLAHLTKALDLTASQQVQVKAILDQARATAAQATDPQAKRQAWGSAFKQIRETVLTAPQQARFEQMHKAQMHRMVFRRLDLTADQKAQVKAILQQARTAAQSATDPQAKHQIHQAAFQKIKDTVLTDQQRTKLAQIHQGQMHRAMFRQLDLTADQKAQVKTIMQQARTAAQSATDVSAKHQVWKDAFAKVKDTVLTDQQRTRLAALQAQRGTHVAGEKVAPAN